MSNNIFDLNEGFDIKLINLGNPTLINNNVYFSKISQGPLNKNVYIQFPKCITKNGITKTSNKTSCDLNYNMSNKNVIEFFENLEKLLVEKIYNNKELWFYDSQDLEKDDIEELMTPIMKPYKHGRNFLVKSYIKNDKLLIYDENENTLTYDDYNLEYEIIPLVNINGIKFTSKNFTLELILSQIMIIYPADEFEKQVLIKTSNSKIISKENTLVNPSIEIKDDTLKKNVDLQEENKENAEESIELTEVSETLTEDNKLEFESSVKDLENIEISKDLDNSSKIVSNIEDDFEANTENDVKDCIEDNKTNIILDDKKEELSSESILMNIVDNSGENITKKEDLVPYNIENINKDNELEDIDIDCLTNNDSIIELKSHDEIYLEIYKKAKKKAKEIRKNAIAAFLEAKNIKDRYNLNHIEDSDSSDDDDENFVSTDN